MEQGHELNIVATYNLINNATFMVEEGMGYAIGFDDIVDMTSSRNLIWKPIYPCTEVSAYIVWKKYQVFSKPAQLFLNTINELIQESI